MADQATGYGVRTGPGSEQASTELGRALNEWLERAGPPGLFRTCASCHRMARDPKPAFCHLWNVVPPVGVLMRGCDRYADEAEPPLDIDIPY